MMRAELGSPFALQAEDFPLMLHVFSANASLRGEEAYTAQTDPSVAPSIFVSFHTEQVDTMARYLLWIGVPVGYFLLSCCCCIFCCCSGVAKGEEKESRLRESELADLSRGFPDDVDATSEMEEEARASRKPSRKERKTGTRSRMEFDDEIVPA